MPLVIGYYDSGIKAKILKSNNAYGLLIVGAGLPGSGKSTTMKELAKIYNTDNIFLEPEENLWPKLLTKKSIVDPINTITWLRANRVPMLLHASELSKEGEIAIVDSYYDKLLYKYIGNKDPRWLIKSDHKYFNTLKEISKLDWENLPNADYIIYFKIDFDTWKKFLISRNRDIDKEIALINYYSAEKSILKACQDLCRVTSTKLIIYQQNGNLSPQENALEIYKMIKSYEKA